MGVTILALRLNSLVTGPPEGKEETGTQNSSLTTEVVIATTAAAGSTHVHYLSERQIVTDNPDKTGPAVVLE